MKSNDSIAFVCHPYHRGGVTSWMAQAASEYAKQGTETFFVTVKPSSAFISSGGRPDMISLLNQYTSAVKVVASEVSYFFELGTQEYRALQYVNQIRKAIPLGTPLIISDDTAVWQAAAMVADQYPIIGVLHSDDQAYYQLAHQYKKYVSRFVAVSNRIVNRLRANQFENADHISVIPCGIYLDQFYPLTSYSNSEKLKMVWVGRIEEQQKRISDIPLIAAGLKQLNIDFELLVIGHGTETIWLQEQLKQQGFTTEVIMKGWMNSTQLSECYRNADLLLQTSNYEGMSVAVMEALASGCAIVSSRVSGVEDYENITSANQCIYVYETGGIEEAITQIRKAKSVSRQIQSEQAVILAKMEFSIEACVKKYKDIAVSASCSKSSWPIYSSELWLRLKSCILAILRNYKYRFLNW